MANNVGIRNISAYYQEMMGEVEKGPCQAIFDFDDSAKLSAVHVQDWKISFRVMEGNLLTSAGKSPNMPIVFTLNGSYKLPDAVPLRK